MKLPKLIKGCVFMKKALSMVLALLMCLTFAACGDSADADAVAAYVDANRTEILNGFEEGFSASGMTCTSSIAAEGTGFVVNVNINELNDVDSATADLMQQSYDAMSGTFDGMLEDMKKELPELTYFVFNICEADGDKLATIEAGNK